MVYVCTGDERPDMKDLGMVLTNHCTEWKDIGANLGLEPPVIKRIAADNPKKNRECFRETLELWLQMDTTATWHKLEEAITKATQDLLSVDASSNQGNIILLIKHSNMT